MLRTLPQKARASNFHSQKRKGEECEERRKATISRFKTGPTKARLVGAKGNGGKRPIVGPVTTTANDLSVNEGEVSMGGGSEALTRQTNQARVTKSGKGEKIEKGKNFQHIPDRSYDQKTREKKPRELRPKPVKGTHWGAGKRSNVDTRGGSRRSLWHPRGKRPPFGGAYGVQVPLRRSHESGGTLFKSEMVSSLQLGRTEPDATAMGNFG